MAIKAEVSKLGPVMRDQIHQMGEELRNVMHDEYTFYRNDIAKTLSKGVDVRINDAFSRIEGLTTTAVKGAVPKVLVVAVTLGVAAFTIKQVVDTIRGK